MWRDSWLHVEIFTILVQIKYMPSRFLRDYYGDSLDVMFPQFPNHFLLFPMVFPYISSGVSNVCPQCFPRSLF